MIPIANPIIGEDEKNRVEDVLDSGYIAEGEVVRAFEDEFAELCGTDYAVATSNGTTALHAAMEALELDECAKVVTTPFSFVASANTIRFAGATPIFADIDLDTFNLDPDAVRARIETEDGDVDAILAVHLYGNPAPINELRAIAEEYDAYLIEDAAQAHGATYRDAPIGSLGDVACFSFYPTKNMTTGEGGMITTNSDEIRERATRFVNHGRAETSEHGYEHVEVGHNFRMTNIAAAIGRGQLEKLPEYTEARRENAALLTEELADANVETPTEQAGGEHVYHQYTIRTSERDELQEYLEANDIGTVVYYPKCIHEQPAYDDYDVSAPNAEQAAEEVLSLPIHPTISAEDIRTIGRHIRDFTKVSQ